MDYSTAQISTKADCDVLLTSANKEKEDVEFRKTALLRQQRVYSTNADEVDAELATVTAEITALDANIATLPEGELKREQVKKKKKAELKQFLLTEKQHDYGVVALLNKEYDLAIIDLQLTELNAFIAALEARKSAIA